MGSARNVVPTPPFPKRPCRKVQIAEIMNGQSQEPGLVKRLDAAHAEDKRGEYTRFNTHEEAKEWLDQLNPSVKK